MELVRDYWQKAGVFIGPFIYFGALILNALQLWSFGLPTIAWAAAGGAVFLASSAAIIWGQHKDIEELQKQSIQKRRRRAIRESLGSFLGEGQELQQRCANEQEQPPQMAADNWATRAESFLSENFGESYVFRFRSHAGLPMAANSIASLPHRNLWAGIHTRVARLEQFLAELSD